MRRAEFAVLLVLASVLVSACGAGTPSGAATAAPASAGSSAGSSSGAASPGSPSAEPTSEPGTDAPTDAPPTAKPSKSPKPSPSGSADPSAATCTGTDDNRTFFADAAQTVDWTVVCAVLPKHWFVSTGSYHRGGGGRLTIGYKGPDGATLTLNEGAWCTDASGCAPAGTEVGPAVLGAMAGTLFALDDGGYAIVLDGGDGISWQLQTEGLSQAKTEKLAAAAVAVTD